MSAELNRRSFVKHSVLASAGAALAGQGVAVTARAADEQVAADRATADATSMPKGRVGNLEISRLLLGGNLLTHYTHSRDLKYVYNLAKNYNTDEKILETLAIAEEHGINTLVVHNVPATIAVLKKHRERGGKMQWITCTFHALVGGLARFNREIEQLVDAGTDALYISGVEADWACGFGNPIWGPDAATATAEAKMDLLGQAVAMAKAHGLPTGLGAHRLGSIEASEKAGLDVDFYLKTFHHHEYQSAKLGFDSSFCPEPERVISVMKSVTKPWIAFKVMAAGAIPPDNAFRFALSGGADFVLAGMFDFEIAEDARLIREIFPTANRARPLQA